MTFISISYNQASIPVYIKIQLAFERKTAVIIGVPITGQLSEMWIRK
jgi:hypothetical protein